MKIGLLSDTHAYWDERYEKYFQSCDEIWHAGDIGSEELADRLALIAPLRAVYGNIDGQTLRARFPKIAFFTVADVKVCMTHIGGYPGRYAPGIREILMEYHPKLFIAGHSHILKVQFDKRLDCLHINPGAAGKQGFHKIRTLVRFVLEAGQAKELEVIELND